MRIDNHKEDGKCFAEQRLNVHSPATSYSIVPLHLNRECLQSGFSRGQKSTNTAAYEIIQGYGEGSFQCTSAEK